MTSVARRHRKEILFIFLYSVHDSLLFMGFALSSHCLVSHSTLYASMHFAIILTVASAKMR